MSEQLLMDGACGEDLKFNPKKKYRKKRRSVNFEYVANPVLDEIRDVDEILKTFQVLPIVPFLEGSDATLSVLRKLRDYSPTHGSCIENQSDYIFGGEFVLNRKKKAGFATNKDEVEVTESEFDAYIEFIENLFPDYDGAQLLEVGISLFDNFKTFGNAYMRIDKYEVAGTKFVKFSSIDCTDIRYFATQPQEDKLFVISPYWGFGYITENPPEFVSAYPNFTENEETGIESTIIHIKTKTIARDWYGTPKTLNSIYFQYMELQLGEYGTDGYAKRWTGDKYIETASDEEDEDDGNDFETQLEETFSNKGHGRRIVYRNRLTSDPQTYIYEFKDTDSHEFHVAMSDESERQIIKSHNWHRVLMGVPSKGKLGPGNEFKEVFRTKYLTVIKPFQVLICDCINKGMSLAFDFYGREDLKEFSLGLGNLFADVLEADIAEKTGNTNEIDD